MLSFLLPLTHSDNLIMSEEKQKNMKRAQELYSELFDIANSFAGDETGSIAVNLHEACNSILRAYELYCRHHYEQRNNLPY